MRELLCFLLCAALGLSCGRTPLRHDPSCAKVHEGCLEYAQQTASDYLDLFVIVDECEWDFGDCIGANTSSVTCDQGCFHAYEFSVCTQACDSTRGIQQ